MPSSEVMGKMKRGTLHSGGPGGPVVKNRKQAIAIMLSEKRKEDANGGKYPEGGMSNEDRAKRRYGKR